MRTANAPVVVLVVLSLFVSTVHAEEPAKKKKAVWKTGLEVVVVETSFLFFSGIAAEDPQLFGTVMGLLAPFAFIMTSDSNDTQATRWVGLGCAEALCAVDIWVLEKGDDEWSHNFDVNFFGLNAIVVVTAVTQHFTKKDEPPKVSLGLEAHRTGEFLTASYHF